MNTISISVVVKFPCPQVYRANDTKSSLGLTAIQIAQAKCTHSVVNYGTSL